MWDYCYVLVYVTTLSGCIAIMNLSDHDQLTSVICIRVHITGLLIIKSTLTF